MLVYYLVRGTRPTSESEHLEDKGGSAIAYTTWLLASPIKGGCCVL